MNTLPPQIPEDWSEARLFVFMKLYELDAKAVEQSGRVEGIRGAREKVEAKADQDIHEAHHRIRELRTALDQLKAELAEQKREKRRKQHLITTGVSGLFVAVAEAVKYLASYMHPH